jgi:DNA gyrase subunit A
VLLVSRKGQALRFVASDTTLRPMGRATSGVRGMRFRSDDELLAMAVIRAGEEHGDQYVFTATDGGYAKRTLVDHYRITGRDGLGVKAMRLNDQRGVLVGAVVVRDGDEVMAIRASGQVTRSAVTGVPAKSRDTMGVKFVDVAPGDQVLAIARNAEKDVTDDADSAGAEVDTEVDTEVEGGVEGAGDAGVESDVSMVDGGGEAGSDDAGDDEVTGTETAEPGGAAAEDDQEPE